MGYTHYWRKVKELDENVFKMFSEDCDMIAHYAFQSEGIGLAGGDGEGYPEFTETHICFNGLGSEAYETFYFSRKEDSRYPDDNGLYLDLTKTARQPYDYIVTACLICSKYHFGKDVYISSDGEPEDWIKGMFLASAIIGANIKETMESLFEKPSPELRKAYQAKIAEEKRIKNIGKPLPGSISTKDTAKLIRADLKANYGKQKFSVTCRDYDVIDVRWTNGPGLKKVESLLGRYKAGYFDGMDDSYHTDGSPYANRYLFFHRDIDHDLYVSEAKRLALEWGCSLPSNVEYNNVFEALWQAGQKKCTDLQRIVSHEIYNTDYMEA